LIWSARYSDSFIENPDLEPIEAECLEDGALQVFPCPQPTIGAFGPQAASQASVLRRLVEAALEVRPFGLWFGSDKEFLSGFLPKSLHALSFRADSDGWANLRGENPKGAFTLVSNSRGERLALQGLPTEEGLDFLVGFVRS